MVYHSFYAGAGIVFLDMLTAGVLPCNGPFLAVNTDGDGPGGALNICQLSALKHVAEIATTACMGLVD
jgi:hypothetical protein